MYELLAKSEHCPDFLSVLLQSANDELEKDISHKYWVLGRNGQGQNMIMKSFTIKELLPNFIDINDTMLIID